MAIPVSAPELAAALDEYRLTGTAHDGTPLTSQELAECLLVHVVLTQLQAERVTPDAPEPEPPNHDQENP